MAAEKMLAKEEMQAENVASRDEEKKVSEEGE